MLALAFGWAVGCLCFAHLPLASSSANLTDTSGPFSDASSAAEYDQPGFKLSLDITLHDLCMQVLNWLALSATAEFTAVAIIANWAVYTKWTRTADRIRTEVELQDRPTGLAKRVAHRANFLIAFWKCSGLQTEVATGLLLLSAFLYKEWWEGVLAALVCAHALRVWWGQELDQLTPVRGYHAMLVAHVVIGSVLVGATVASCFAWLWSWVLPQRWLSLLPGRLLRAAFMAYYSAASVSLRQGFLDCMEGYMPEMPEGCFLLRAPGATLAYKGGPQFWWAAAYPLATLLWRGHTWLPLLLVASCCGGWWAALLRQACSQAEDMDGGIAGRPLWVMLSQLPFTSQVLLAPWIYGGIVKDTPPPSELVDYWRGRVECDPSVCTHVVHAVAAVFQLLGLLPVALLSGLGLAPHWFPEYFSEVLALIAFQASMPFGTLSLLLRSSLRPSAILQWPVFAVLGCACATLLACKDVRWICEGSLDLLDSLGMEPVADGIQSSFSFLLAGVFWVLSTTCRVLSSCCFAGTALLALAIRFCLKWAGRCVAFLAAVLTSAMGSSLLPAVTLVGTKLQGVLSSLDPRRLNAPTGQQRRTSGGYMDDGCLAMLQSGAKKTAPKQKGRGKKAGKGPPPASKAAASSPAAAPAVPASKAGQSSLPAKASIAKAGASSPAAPPAAAAPASRKRAAATAGPESNSSRAKERAAVAAAEPLAEPSGKAADSSSIAQPEALVVAVHSPQQPCTPTASRAAAAKQGPTPSASGASARASHKQQAQRRQQQQQRQPTQPSEPAAQLWGEAPAAFPSNQPSQSSNSNATAVHAGSAGSTASHTQTPSVPAACPIGAASSSQLPQPSLPAAPSTPAKTAPAAAAAAPTAASVVAAAAQGEDLEEGEECVLCLDHSVQCVLVPCGHLCLCLGCTRLLFGADGSGRGGRCSECPLCRQQVQQWVKVHC